MHHWQHMYNNYSVYDLLPKLMAAYNGPVCGYNKMPAFKASVKSISS